MLKFVKNLGKFSPSGGKLSRKRSDSVCLDNENSNTLTDGIYVVRDKELGKLHKAAWYGQLEKVKALARRDPSPLDKCHRTPLHLACCQGHAAIVQELLAWNARTSISDKEGKTPFMKAVQCGHFDVVEVLLSYKVDVEARDGDGNTCLHLAVQYGHLEILNAMLNAWSNANLKNMAGKTPLHYAVIEDKINIAMALLQNRADVNSIDIDHKTALMFACQMGNDNMVSLLLNYQAAIHVKDTNGWTASDHALIKGYNSCVQLLENYQKSQKLHFSEDTIDLDESPASSSRLKQSNRGLAKRRVSMSPGHQPVPIAKQSENIDDSAEETGTLSRSCSPAKDTGSDCWGDDTDISITTDDKNNKGQMRVNLAKFVPKSSDSEDFDNLENPYSTIDFPRRGSTFVPTKTFNEIEESVEISSNVSSKEKIQLADTLNTSSENFNTVKEVTAEPIYATVNKTKKLTLEQQRAFMDELGLSDSEDFIDTPAPTPFDQKSTGNSGFDVDGESDWDSVVAEDVSKKENQQEQLLNEDVFAAFNEIVQSKKPQQNLFHSETNYFEETDENNGDTKQNEDLISRKPSVTKNDWDSSCLSSPSNYAINESKQHKDGLNQYKSEANQHNSKDFLHQMSLSKESESGDEDSDWDSLVNSTNLPKSDVPGTKVSITTTNTSMKVDQEEYLQRTSSLRRMSSAAKNLDMAASKIIACSSQPSDYLIESSGLYKNAYEEFVSSVGLVADMTPDLTAKTQIMEKLDNISDVSSRLLLVANAVSTDQTDHSAKNKLSDAARFVTECIDQLINVCSGIETEEDEATEENNEGESQVNESFLFVRDSELSRSMGELRQSYLYEPHSNGNVVEEEDSAEQFSEDRVDANLKNAAESAAVVAKLSEETLFQMQKESLESTVMPLSIEKKHSHISGGSIETKDKSFGDSEEMKPVRTLEEPKLNETSKYSGSTVLSAPSLQQVGDIQQSIPQGKKSAETMLEDFAGFGFLDSSDVLKDDDMLSVTSFETDNNLSTVNYEKDVLMNLNLNDPTSAAKLQLYINDCRQRLKKEKNQRTLIENQYRVLQEDNKNVQKKLQLVSQEKAALEQNKIGLEAKISDLKYKLAEESDKCKDEEIFLEQCKKQQEKMEQLYKKECEDKQEVDHCLYQTQLELKWMKNSLQRLESENEELHSQRDRLMQEGAGGGGKQSQTSQLHISQMTQTSESLPDQNFSAEMVQLKEENQKLREEMSELKMSTSQKQLSETVELHRVIEELQEGKKCAEMLTKDIQHQMELKENTSSLEKLQMNDNLKRLQEERDKYQQDFLQVQSERDSTKQDLATYQERLKNMDRLHQLKNNDQDRLISQLRMELEKEQSTNRELQECLSSAKKQISKLQNKEEEMNAVLAEQKHLLQESKYKRDNLHEETKEQLLSVQHAKERLESDLKTLQLQKSDLEIELRREKDKVKIFQRNFEKPQNDDKDSLIHDLQMKDAELQGKLEQEKHKSAVMQRILDEHLAHPNTSVSTVAREEEKIQSEIDEPDEPLKMPTEPKHRDIALEEEIKDLRFQLKREKEYWNKRLEQERKMMKSQLEKEKHKVKMLQEKQVNADDKLEEEEEKNHLLQCEITALKSRLKHKDNKTKNHLTSSLPLQSDVAFDDRFNETDDFRYQRHPQLDKQLRVELSKKLEEVNRFLQQQHEQYEQLMIEKENKISADRNKLQSELNQMRLNYENALSTKSLQEQEALHFRELYLKELSRYQGAQPIFYGGYDPLWRFTSLNYRIPEKSPLDLNSSMLNSSSKFHARNASMNSTPSEVGQINQEYHDVYGKLKEEMHRSIKRHLEAPPFDEQVSSDSAYMKMSPLTVLQGSGGKPLGLIELNNALTQSKAEYLTLMKHKYCL